VTLWITHIRKRGLCRIIYWITRRIPGFPFPKSHKHKRTQTVWINSLGPLRSWTPCSGQRAMMTRVVTLHGLSIRCTFPQLYKQTTLLGSLESTTVATKVDWKVINLLGRRCRRKCLVWT